MSYTEQQEFLKSYPDTTEKIMDDMFYHQYFGDSHYRNLLDQMIDKLYEDIEKHGFCTAVLDFLKTPDELTDQLYEKTSDGQYIFPWMNEKVKKAGEAGKIYPMSGTVETQTSKFHGETNTQHTIAVVGNTVKVWETSKIKSISEKDMVELALLHDIGKKYCLATNAMGETAFPRHGNLSAYIAARLWKREGYGPQEIVRKIAFLEAHLYPETVFKQDAKKEKEYEALYGKDTIAMVKSFREADKGYSSPDECKNSDEYRFGKEEIEKFAWELDIDRQTRQADKHPVVFLDIDGVLNLCKCDQEQWGDPDGWSKYASHEAVKRVAELCHDTGAHVVLNSTWGKALVEGELPESGLYDTSPTESLKDELKLMVPVDGYTRYGNFGLGHIPDKVLAGAEYVKRHPEVSSFIFIEDGDIVHGRSDKAVSLYHPAQAEEIVRIADKVTPAQLIDTNDYTNYYASLIDQVEGDAFRWGQPHGFSDEDLEKAEGVIMAMENAEKEFQPVMPIYSIDVLNVHDETAQDIVRDMRSNYVPEPQSVKLSHALADGFKEAFDIVKRDMPEKAEYVKTFYDECMDIDYHSRDFSIPLYDIKREWLENTEPTFDTYNYGDCIAEFSVDPHTPNMLLVTCVDREDPELVYAVALDKGMVVKSNWHKFISALNEQTSIAKGIAYGELEYERGHSKAENSTFQFSDPDTEKANAEKAASNYNVAIDNSEKAVTQKNAVIK